MVLPIDEYLTPRRAAEALGIGVDTLGARRRGGEIPYYKVGGRYYYRLADLRAYLESKRVEAKARPAEPPPVVSLPEPKHLRRARG